MTPSDISKSEASIAAIFVGKGFPAADISVAFSAGAAGRRSRRADTIKVTVTIKVDQTFSLVDFSKGANKMGDTKFSLTVGESTTEHTVKAADIVSMVKEPSAPASVGRLSSPAAAATASTEQAGWAGSGVTTPPTVVSGAPPASTAPRSAPASIKTAGEVSAVIARIKAQGYAVTAEQVEAADADSDGVLTDTELKLLASTGARASKPAAAANGAGENAGSCGWCYAMIAGIGVLVLLLWLSLHSAAADATKAAAGAGAGAADLASSSSGNYANPIATATAPGGASGTPSYNLASDDGGEKGESFGGFSELN